jgi:hypothetical protein
MTQDAFRELILAPGSRLEQLLRAGRAANTAALAGSTWRGFNQSWRVRRLGLQKFIKGFFEAGGGLEGYNIPVLQNGLEGAWLPQPTPERPRRYAFYCVTPVDPTSSDALYPNALLIDYGASPRNPPRAIERRLRDYLVQPYPANPDVLLGKAYLAFGRYRLPSNFFILQRLGPSDWRP